MDTEQLRQRILFQLAARGEGAGFARVVLDMYSEDEIDAAVEAMHREGLLNAELVPRGFGPGKDRWEPSTLTPKGRTLVTSPKPIDPANAVCPDCQTRLVVADDSVRVGSGLVDNASWRTGYLFDCPGCATQWHLLEGASYLSRSTSGTP